MKAPEYISNYFLNHAPGYFLHVGAGNVNDCLSAPLVAAGWEGMYIIEDPHIFKTFCAHYLRNHKIGTYNYSLSQNHLGIDVNALYATVGENSSVNITPQINLHKFLLAKKQPITAVFIESKNPDEDLAYIPEWHFENSLKMIGLNKGYEKAWTDSVGKYGFNDFKYFTLNDETLGTKNPLVGKR